MRGWTQRQPRELAAGDGFPAHAGMDLPVGFLSAGGTGLPRACGDGPTLNTEAVLAMVASPRMRGWTRADECGVGVGPGFPAHAGMDPPAFRWWGRSQGLPRACGDGPACYTGSPGRWMASPRMRGWTPEERGTPPHYSRLPRACGDGPAWKISNAHFKEASPRMRGWTHRAVRLRGGRAGFPAHAGMDPSFRAAPRSPRRLPRACGDGPVAEATGGDINLASPRMRGWTLPWRVG